MNTSVVEMPAAQPALLPQHKAPAVITPMDLLQMAMNQGADLDRLERLMQMKQQYEADEARKAFNAAFAGFKGEAVRILRTKKISDGPLKGQKHAELGEIIQTVSPLLSAHGLSLSWRLTKDDKDWIEVTCVLKHAAGHSESVSMGGEPDKGPGRNAIQARGSAKTYLERYTATAILGLAASDADDDGRGGPAGTAEFNPESNAKLQSLIDEGEGKATEGTKALTSWWQSLGAGDRELLMPKFGDLKAAARKFDSDPKGSK